MSSEEFEKYDEFDDLSLNGEDDGRSDLDEYGVWIKKKPNDPSGSQDGQDTGEKLSINDDEDEIESKPFDFDGGAEEDMSMQDGSMEEEVNKQDESASFDDIDMSDFFTDFESDDNEETAAKEDEVALNMDLNFDNMDSFAEDDDDDDFDAMLREAEGKDLPSSVGNVVEDVEMDDLLSDSTSLQSFENMQDEQNVEDISISIDVDETQDFSNLSSGEEDASLSISKPSMEEVYEDSKSGDEDKILIKNTVVEPENIDEIVEKNKQVLGEELVSEEKSVSSDIHFNDVEALARDLAKGEVLHQSPSIPALVQVEGLDRFEGLLQSMIQELKDIKEEIASLKRESGVAMQTVKESLKNEETSAEEAEDSGFFKDEDTDETIALTGDELNNILITADFTEETGRGENLGIDESFVQRDGVEEEFSGSIEDSVGEEDGASADDSLEVCGENEKNIDEDVEFENEKDFNFDEIELDNPKLDDFVIPEELDYNMLNIEDKEASSENIKDESLDERVENTDGADMSYLDEKEEEEDAFVQEQEDEDVAGLPKSQEISVSCVADDISSINESGESLNSFDDASSAISENSKSSDFVDAESSFEENEDALTDDSAVVEDNSGESEQLPSIVKKDVKSVLSYMDQLLESLPEEKLKEFAESEYFEMYKKLFKELGL